MKQKTKQKIADSLGAFRLPRYEEIPDVGLFLEQTAKYISEHLSPLDDCSLTPSMISNYVKKDLVANPVKKRYYRDQIAHLMFIMMAKSVVSLDNLNLFIRLQERTYPTERAYNYLCDEFENMLQYIFGLKDTMDNVGVDSTDEKIMLRNTINTIAHKIYLDKYFEALASETEME